MNHIPVRHIEDRQQGSVGGGRFSIRQLDAMVADKDMVHEPHRHSYFFILFFEKGNGVHEIDFTSYLITNHCIFFLRPGQVHQFQLKAGGKGYLLQFSTEYYFPYDHAARHLVNYYQPKPESFQQLSSIINLIFNEFTNQRPRYQDVIKSQLNTLLIELLREQPAEQVNYTLHTQERLDKFRSLLEQHILTHKQVSQYAALMNLSAYQLNNLTKSALGKTSSELINEQIVLEAKRCLLATPHQVNQVAYHLGFDDVSYFSRFFKKQTGHSPESFRQNFR